MARSFFERLTGSVRVDEEKNEAAAVDEFSKKSVRTKGNKPKSVEGTAMEPKRRFALGPETMDYNPEPLANKHGETGTVSSTDAQASIIEANEDEADGELMLDVYDDGAHFIVQSTVAGVKPEEIDISLDDGTLTIRGERKQAHETREKNYYSKELYWGKFSRSVVFPEEVDGERVEASVKEGLLTVKIPKKHKGEKKIRVKVG